MDTETNSSMISRREILKRGAFVGGAVLWVTPVVQAVGIGRAYAKAVSNGCSRYCIKWEVDDNPPLVPELLTCTAGGANAYPVWGNTWTGLGSAPEIAKALTCSDGVDTDSTAQAITKRKDSEFVVYGDQSVGFWVAFPPDVKLADLKDEGLDSVGAKCGTATETFTPTVENDPCLTDSNENPYRRIHVPAYCGLLGTIGISHIEMIVDWCPNSAPPS